MDTLGHLHPTSQETALKLLVFLKTSAFGWKCAAVPFCPFFSPFFCVKILPVSDVLHNSICSVQYTLSKWEQTDTRVALSRAVLPEWIWGFQLVTRSSSSASVQAKWRSCPAGCDASLPPCSKTTGYCSALRALCRKYFILAPTDFWENG